MSKKTGGWNGYDPCESGVGAGKKCGWLGSVEKVGKSVVRRVCSLSGHRGSLWVDGEEGTKFGRVRGKNLPVLLTVTCCFLVFFVCLLWERV